LSKEGGGHAFDVRQAKKEEVNVFDPCGPWCDQGVRGKR